MVDVYCVRHSPEVPEREVASGVSVFRYPLAENYERPLLKPLKRAGIPLLRYSLWVRRMARAEKYDVMLFNQWPLAHVLFAGGSSRSKIVLDWCEVRNGAVYKSFMRLLPKLARRNVAVSQAVAERVSTASGQTVEYLPSGVWVSKYRRKPKEQRSGLVYLGRVTEHKNLPLLVEAFELMKAQGYPETLTIAGAGVGAGAALEQLKARVSASRFAADIHLLGFIDNAKKVELLAGAKALVISSKREGFPRVVAEAMASGLPIATVDFPDNGTKTVVQEYAVGLVSPPDAVSFTATIFQLLKSWDEYSRHGIEGSATLDWSNIVDKLLN